jgi:predicted amidohydrolase
VGADKLAQGKNNSSLADLLLSFYEKKLPANTIVPKYSREILGAVLKESINQYLAIRDKDPSVNPLDVIETTFLLTINFSRKKNPPIILIRNLSSCFNSDEKKSPYTTIVVQPSFPQSENYNEKTTETGKLMVVKEQAITDIREKLLGVLEKIKLEDRVDFVCFPELFFINCNEFCETLSQFVKQKDCFVVGGSFHDEKDQSNVAVIFSPKGELFRQNKIFAAAQEGIKEKPIEYLNIISFPDGHFCVLICLDSEREAVRAILKETLSGDNCPEIVFIPSHTEHPSRALGLLANNLMLMISSAIVFSNTNQKGKSAILFPRVTLKKKGFKMFELPASPHTKIGKAEIDTVLLAQHRKAKQKGLVSLLK